MLAVLLLAVLIRPRRARRYVAQTELAGGTLLIIGGHQNAKPKKADAEATTPKKRGRPAKKAATVVDEQEVTPEKDDEDMKTEGHDVGPEKGIDSEAGAGQGIKAEGED